MSEGIYRVISRTKKREEDQPLEKDGEILNARDLVKLLAETFYPEDAEEEDNLEHRATRVRAEIGRETTHDHYQDQLFTKTELHAAVASFNAKKAPGANGFTADICLHAVKHDTDFFVVILNKCLTCHYFPEAWKLATVVALRKPGRDNYSNPKAYRPIGLLPVLGKVLEKNMVARLKYHFLHKMSTRQHGFMPQKSTEDSLLYPGAIY